MKVKEVMVGAVATCSAEDGLNRAAQLMWENDCGIVPVVERDQQLVGVLSDRDAFMAAYTKGLPLSEIRVGDVMTRDVSTCGPEEDAGVLVEAMRSHRVRRLPVVDAAGRVVGIVSLGDVARRAVLLHDGASAKPRPEDVAEALAAICEPWNGSAKATAESAADWQIKARLQGASPER